jgi:hypothetical protein
MSYNTTTGVYTAATGATTATAGQTIASATWNSINSDYQTALTQIGPANLPFINGAKVYYFCTAPQTVNFAASAGDVATFSISSILPPGATNYRLESIRISNAQGNLNASVVSLFTAAAGGGVAVITSTATTITTSLPNTSNSSQIIVAASANNVMWSATQLFLHITSSTATSNSADVIVGINPYY